VPGTPLIGGVIILIGMLALHLPLFLTQNFVSFVDRDMLMRFHWGLGVGHVYTHQQLCTDAAMVWNESECRPKQSSRPEPSNQMGMEEDIGSGTGTDDSGSESDDSDYKPSEGDEAESGDDEDDSDSEHLLDNEEMYGQHDSDDDLFEDI